MSTELATRPSYQVLELESDSRYASVLYKSGLFTDVKNEAQAVVKVMAGRELSISPFVAMRDLSIIQGKIAMAAAQVAARIQQAGGSWKVHQNDKKGTRLEFFTAGKSVGECSFSWEEAQELGLTSKENYKRQPAVMMFWRCMTKGARMFYPAVFNGSIYTPEELRNGEGELPLPVAEERPRVNVVPIKLEAVAPAPVTPPAANPWLYRLEGTKELKGDWKGKALVEIPEAVLKKALSPSQANKTTELDRVTIRCALESPEAKEAAADALVAAKAEEFHAQANLSFEDDDIPNFPSQED